MPTTTTNPVSILARGVKGAAGFKRAGILHDALCRCDGTTLSVTTTDLEVCAVATIPAPADAAPGASIVSTTTGEPVADRSPDDYPAVGRLDGTTVATILTTFGEVERIADHIVPATDDESSRFALGGVYLDWQDDGTAFAIGTDGRRMHIARFSSIATAPATAIVSPRVFTAFLAACRAAYRAAGLKRPSAGDQVGIAISTQGVSVSMDNFTVEVVTVARPMEGRFPDWRRVIGGEGEDVIPRVVPAVALAGWCRSVTTATADARSAAGDAAVAALPADVRDGLDRRAESKRRSVRGAAESSHPRGIRLDRDGATALGCVSTLDTVPCPWTVRLDPVYLGQALAAAADWNGTANATIHASNPQSAVRIPGGAWDAPHGAGFLAVVMPLAQD